MKQLQTYTLGLVGTATVTLLGTALGNKSLFVYVNDDSSF